MRTPKSAAATATAAAQHGSNDIRRRSGLIGFIDGIQWSTLHHVYCFRLIFMYLICCSRTRRGRPRRAWGQKMKWPRRFSAWGMQHWVSGVQSIATWREDTRSIGPWFIGRCVLLGNWVTGFYGLELESIEPLKSLRCGPDHQGNHSGNKSAKTGNFKSFHKAAGASTGA